MRLIFGGLFIILMFIPMSVFADVIDDSVEAVKRQDYGQALELCKPLADAGDARAQFLIGYLYRNGYGVEENPTVAISWFVKAAESGNADAQLALGYMFINGIGTAVSGPDAEKWYRRAADQGSVEGQVLLGRMLLFGVSIEQNTVEAVTWLRKAAEQGSLSAFFFLGYAFQDGQGVEKNAAEAAAWYRKAADQGVAAAQNNLGNMLLKGIGIESNPSEALVWLRKAAEQDDDNAFFNLGYAYINGIGVEKNGLEAEAWFRKAVEKGNVSAPFLLGWMSFVGLELKQDDAQAIFWFRKGAELGDERSTNVIPIVEEKISVRKKFPDSPKVFGVHLMGAQREEMRLALSRARLKPIREENKYFADLYDSSAIFKNSDQMQAYYALEADKGGNSDTDFLAKVIYRFPSENDIGQVHEIQKMVSSKYGKVDVKNISDDLRDVSFTWKRDGVDIIVERSWPDTTTYLIYVVNGFSEKFKMELEDSKK